MMIVLVIFCGISMLMGCSGEGVFVATNQWQKINEDTKLPAGLHVRINLQTGEKEAKLLDEKEGDGQPAEENRALSNVGPVEDSLPDILDPREVKAALKKIKNDAKEKSHNTEVPNHFRTYEEIKKEMEGVNTQVTSESAIIKQLVESYPQSDLKADVIEDLEFYVHQFDNALDFVKMGGLALVVLPALNSSDLSLRSNAALLLGSACQSNPKVQIASLESGVLPHLIRLIAMDKNGQVRNRALFAISSLTRRFPLAQRQLMDQGGITTFAEVLSAEHADVVKLQLKIITLLTDLVAEKKFATAKVTAASESIIRWKQYEGVDIEGVLVEQGFCRLLPRLLTRIPVLDDQEAEFQEHDMVEKVIQAMTQLSDSCRNTFQSFSPLVQRLSNKYHQLFLDDFNEAGSYFKEIDDSCRQLLQLFQTNRQEL